MGFTLAGVRRMGTPFPCYLAEYVRTIVYRIPGLYYRDNSLSPISIFDAADFRASIVTDLLRYLGGEGSLLHYGSDATIKRALIEQLGDYTDNSADNLFIVIQFNEDMRSFPAVDGQCIRIEHNDIEELAIVDCGDPYTPHPNDRSQQVDSLLASINIVFEVTDGFDRVFDDRCYRTTDGEILTRLTPKFEARPSVSSPILREELLVKLEATSALFPRIDDAISDGSAFKRKRKWRDARKYFEELIHALHLDPSRDDAYRRLWYLQLWDRIENFGKAMNLQIPNDREFSLEYKLRNDIAHRGVERMDGDRFRSIQIKVHNLIRRQLA